MKNTFDKRLPETTSYWIEGQIFYIKNTNFFVSEAEGLAMAELMVFAMEEVSTKGIVIDNTEATGAWTKEISQIWESDSKFTQGFKNKRVATLTNSAVTTMQNNRLSRDLGMKDTARAFNHKFDDEVKAFLLD